MKSRTPDLSGIVVSGLGIAAAIGQGKQAFIDALLEARHVFTKLERPGRQVPLQDCAAAPAPSAFLGAEIARLSLSSELDSEKGLRTASLSSRAALVTLDEAWREAGLQDVDPARIGLVVGGSNLQQRELVQTQARHAARPEFLRPSYAVAFLDTDICGFCSELFPIRGFAYTLGAASASGLLAVLQAVRAVQSGEVDACIALGALMDISYWECLAFRAIGAMGSDRFAEDPAAACRPFDQDRDGFIFGEACGAIVVEREGARRLRAPPYARVLSGAVVMDGNRNPNPSLEGECRVIQRTLQQAGLSPDEIDYVNPHGTGSLIGDAIELQALKRSKLEHAHVNATKSITGHGLSAAGAVEVIATLLQMRAGRPHPTRNLSNPIDASFNWVRDTASAHRIRRAVSLSMGFGGVSAAICLENCDSDVGAARASAGEAMT